MKRATLLMETELYRRAKALSKKRGVTLKEVINHLVREGLNRLQTTAPQKPFSFPRHRGMEPVSGLNIADRESLHDILDSRKR